MVSTEQIKSLLMKDDIQIWSVPFYFDQYREDNDTDDEEEEEGSEQKKEESKAEKTEKAEKKKRRIKHLTKIRAFEFFIYKEKIHLRKQEKKRLNMQKEVSSEDKGVISSNLLFSNSDLLFDDDKFMRSEYIPSQKNDKIKEIEQKWIKQGENIEPEEDWSWLEEVCLLSQLPKNLAQ